MGEPVIRTALRHGMRVLARQFVMGRTIEEALARAATTDGRRWRYSFDMLGEAAKTHDDAERYMHAYRDAIGAIGRPRPEAAGRAPGFRSSSPPSIPVTNRCRRRTACRR